MYAMQYEITLPADYDMGIIRNRVAARGASLDHFAGLGIKAYGIRERGVDGSTLNQYSPFYLWADTDGMGRFLWGGGGFDAIIESFGRPSVHHHWTGAGFRPGPAVAATPRAATRHLTSIPQEVSPAEAVREALAELDRRAKMPGVHSSAVAVDPSSWQMVQFTLWEDTADGPGERYQVLHLSDPYMDALSPRE